MGSPDYFLYAKHMSVSLEIPLKDFRGQVVSGIKGRVACQRTFQVSIMEFIRKEDNHYYGWDGCRFTKQKT